MGLTGRSDIGLSFPVLSAAGWSRTSHVGWPLWGGGGCAKFMLTVSLNMVPCATKFLWDLIFVISAF